MVRSHRVFLKKATKQYQACLGPWEEHPEKNLTQNMGTPCRKDGWFGTKPFELLTAKILV